ncbi:hypothetical protein MMF93_09680 [Streptomyces tubbatahanensis]|uniref:DUF732 domain-containing protein n=1 Tax=Streptomyces tubbatahanensis TaxID=2923272 RepID=A0ABY3XQN0_9ACTN|nr:hypothetical protein [Streptomyces tubbatahanensis]UNS96752.1 hypothetical protein MMF93_09680 [Streptomyces tubbatahanensis]
MSTVKAARAAAAALVAAALALTAGCGGDDDRQHGEGAGSGHAGRPGATATASPGASAAPHAEDDGGAPGGEATAKVPRSRLTPATGSFTKKEKDYLVDRVPRGLEPAAVLEAGRTACERIATTADSSEKDAISALKAGEIDQAEPAIRHLCPKFAPLLEAAGK